jgi:metal-dependent amidase/aminoacylase/carboxypeptidase family protein
VARPRTPADLERLVADVETPHGPLERFVFMQAQATEGEVRLSYRCWPPERYVQVREAVHRSARSAGGVAVFPDDPFPALVAPRREALALQRYLGRDRARRLYAAVPYSGEDYALFLDRMPGTYTFLGVRRPGAAIETSYPHFGAFDPDERAIGHGVRAMAGWLATRAGAR